MDVFNTKTTGEKLKSLFNLTNIRYVWIQRAIGIPFPVYIITYDSRFPTNYLPRVKITKSKSMSFHFVNAKGETILLSDLKTFPPVLIEDFNGYVGDKTFIIKRDILGDRYVKGNIFECVENKYKKLYLKI